MTITLYLIGRLFVDDGDTILFPAIVSEIRIYPVEYPGNISLPCWKQFPVMHDELSKCYGVDLCIAPSRDIFEEWSPLHRLKRIVFHPCQNAVKAFLIKLGIAF